MRRRRHVQVAEPAPALRRPAASHTSEQGRPAAAASARQQATVVRRPTASRNADQDRPAAAVLPARDPAPAATGLARAFVVVPVLALLAGVAWWLQPTAEQASAQKAARATATALERVLTDIQQAWQPEERRRVLSFAAEQSERFSAVLPQFLARGDSPLLRPGLELAGFLRVQAALPAIQKLALRPGLRLAALAAADNIEPLSDGEIAELLQDADETVIVAGLAMASRRNPPLPDVIALLAHENNRVADAAMASLPLQLPVSLRPALEEISRNERKEVAARGFRGLLRVDAPEPSPQDEEDAPAVADGAAAPPAPRSRDELTQAMDARDDATRVEALRELAQAPQPEDHGKVLDLLHRGDSDAVRKQACLYLGQVESRDAVRPLIDVLTETANDGLRANAHWALQRITGLRLRPEPELWEQWWKRCGPAFAAPPPAPR